MSLQWFAAVYTGLIATAYACLLINGFAFQFAEDGAPLSLWVRIPYFRIRLPEPRVSNPISSSSVVFGISFFIAIATFKAFAGFSYAKPVALWIIYVLWPVVCVVIYIISQLILVYRTLMAAR